VLRHNYNLLFQAIRVDGMPVGSPAPLAIPIPLPGAAGPPPPQAPTPPAAPAPAAPASPEKPKETTPATPPAKPAAPSNAPLEIKPYASPTTGNLPAHG
jgi:hypothetical protein